MNRQYIAIDLKSFYASVECVERGLDPLNTNLVVADLSRTEKTICLAVSPSLKAYGIPGRARLFEVIQRVREVNAQRLSLSHKREFVGSSHFASFLQENPDVKLDYIVAEPRMSHYMRVSSEIYAIYLKYIAPEDIHVYSVDEVFIDATGYLKTYGLTARELADRMIRDVLAQTGITATAGIGTNLYLCKIAMDIQAKHIVADKDGVRIAELDERSYRENLWNHRPITDFWRIGRGYADKLKRHGMLTMGDVARVSLQNEELLYKLFGINAELLIDHAWGYESCTIADIKAYSPRVKSLSSGQVLKRPYEYSEAKLIIREMAELLALDLVSKRLLTDQMELTIGYDIKNVSKSFSGEIVSDRYGRKIPKQSHGSENIGRFTSSSRLIVDAVIRLFERIADRELLVRRMYVVANHTVTEDEYKASGQSRQLCLFTDFDNNSKEEKRFDKEKSIQHAVISLQRRYGKNAVLKGMNLKDGATSIERNSQIGGHKA